MTAPPEAEAFSSEDLQLAEASVAEVALKIGMTPLGEFRPHPALYQEISAAKSPPRRFLEGWRGKRTMRRPVHLDVEISEDGRTIYISVSDYTQGSATPAVEHLTKRLQENIEATFPRALITHENKVGGPHFDFY